MGFNDLLRTPMARTVIDLTQSLNSNVPVYPGDPPLRFQQSCTVPGDGYSVHALSCSSHAGTHIDAPSHFLADGATIDQLPPSAFILPALVLDVSHKKARECIAWDALAPVADRIRPGTAVLFQTGWSRYYWGAADCAVLPTTTTVAPPPSNSDPGRLAHHYFDHPWLAADVAERLLALGVRVVGTDTMSPDQSPFPASAGARGERGANGAEGEGPVSDFGVHKALLGAGGLIVENLANLDTLMAAQDAAGPDAEVIVSLLPLKIAGCDGSPIRAVAWLQPRGSFL
jgi:kynurenine formamidase